MTEIVNPELTLLHKNPIYDEVITIHSKQFKIPTKSSKNKIVQKGMTAAFRKIISADRKKKSQNIFQTKLIVAIHIFGKESYIKKADVDNFAKFILDAFKGVIYKDDKQIYNLIVSKENGKGDGVWIGIREMKDDLPLYPYIPLMYKDEIWNEELYHSVGENLGVFSEKDNATKEKNDR